MFPASSATDRRQRTFELYKGYLVVANEQRLINPASADTPVLIPQYVIGLQLSIAPYKSIGGL